MIVYCVRHGETASNSQGRIQGQLDTQLSPLGQRQALAVAAALKNLPIDAIYSSPLLRALETAQSIADVMRLPVVVDSRLMEINAGVFQGLCWDEIERDHSAAARQWKSHDPDFCIPEGESRRALMVRAQGAFAAIREAAHRAVVVVAHGGLLSAAFKVLLEIPAERNPFSLQNGSISKLAWDQQVKLLTLNETGHLSAATGGGGDL